jgi:hypothetical protein
MPTQANEIIKFLNSKTREELEELRIEDRKETILEVKRVLTKRGTHATTRRKGSGHGPTGTKVFQQD